jgi:superoxide dismutase, Fe-Mn family
MKHQYLQRLLTWCEETANVAYEHDLRKLKSEIHELLTHEKIAMEDVEQIKQKADRLYKNHVPNERIAIGEHKLPALPYGYGALEPYISKRIMELHHKKHHKSYVDGLNKAEKELEKAREVSDFTLIKHWERELAFHGSGHYLHTIFWYIMSPQGGGWPKGNLLKQIEKDFTSYEDFKAHFSAAAKNVEGVGWAILVWSPRSHRLEILQAEKHQNISQWDTIPLFLIDVWEHAYYLQYENEREKYINRFWNVVNWEYVEKRFNQAKKLKWKAY